MNNIYEPDTKFNKIFMFMGKYNNRNIWMYGIFIMDYR